MNTHAKSNDTSAQSLSRRDLIAGLSAVTVLAGSGAAFAQHEHHEHHGGGAHAGLAAAANDCVQKGEACLTHCLQMLGTGDTSLAECAVAVRDSAATCQALSKLAMHHSAFASAMAGVALEVCTKCEAECRKHEEHPECKACAESCSACIKACKEAQSA